jgi:hypothetical protein
MTMLVAIVPMDRPNADSLVMFVQDLAAAGFDTVLGGRAEMPKEALDRSREQYRANVVLTSLHEHPDTDVLGVCLARHARVPLARADPLSRPFLAHLPLKALAL